MRHRLLRPLAVSLLAVPAVLASPLAARAQTVAPGFALSPDPPAERGNDWMAADALDLRGDARLAVGATFDHSRARLPARYDKTSVLVRTSPPSSKW